MTRLVKKFGGTSLRTEERIELAVAEVIDSLEAGDDVTAVVSAIGKDGDPYATDSLIGMLEDISPHVDPMVQDMMMSSGEVISASVFAHYLRSRDYEAVPMTGFQAGIFTTEEFGNAKITDLDPVRMEKFLHEGKPVVLAGFQGVTVKNQITTLGRGGSDTTAMTVAGHLGADLVEIFTDVPGIAVVDPDLVDDPPFFSSIPRNALLTLTKYGGSVIHPRAVMSGIEHEVPFTVKCGWKGDRQTVVDGSPASSTTPLGIALIDGLNGYKITREPGTANMEEITKRSEYLFPLDETEGVALLSEDENVVGAKEFDRFEGLSLITGVSTRPAQTSVLVNRIHNSVSDGDYLGNRELDNGIQYLVPAESSQRVIRSVYDLFY